MSLGIARLAFVCITLTSAAAGQSVGDLGLMGGSGVALAPNAATYPATQFRLDVVRLGFLRKGSMNLTGINISAGLSPNVEVFAKFQSGETGSELSQAFLGIGGKYLLPFSVPTLGRIALWSEIMSTENGDKAVFYPSQVTRGAMVFQPPIAQNIPTNILVGLTSVDAQTRFLGGVSASWATGPTVRVGAEFVYGYYGMRDAQELATVGVSIFSNVCVQMSPGYFHSPDQSSWVLLMGISFSSTDIEFIPKPEEKEIFIVPPIEEMEKKFQEEPKKDH